MLQFQVILLLLVKPSEDEDLSLKLIGSRAHPGRQLVVDSEWDLAEDRSLESFPADVDLIEDFWLVGFVHHFEEESLEEVVLAGPVKDQVLLGLVVVPLGQDVGLFPCILLAVLILEDDGDGEALPLLKDLLVSALVGVGDVEFAVVILKGVLRGSLDEVVHDEDGDAIILPVSLVDLVEYLGGFVYFEVYLAGVEVEDGLE